MSSKPTVASLEARINELTARVAALESSKPARRAYAADPSVPETPKPSHDAPWAERTAWAKAESKRTGKCVAIP